MDKTIKNSQQNQENSVDVPVTPDPEDIAEMEKIIEKALADTGLGRKIVWEDLRANLIGILNTTVKNLKLIPGINIAAALVEKPVEGWYTKAKNRKEFRKEDWAVSLGKNIREQLNGIYLNRSAEELSNTKAQDVKSYIENIQKASVDAVFQRARNISNQIMLGVTAVTVGISSISNPWVLPIVAATTAGACSLQRRINKRQIKVNVAKNSVFEEKSKDVHTQQQQVLDNAPYYANVNGFENAMRDTLDKKADDEIIANRDKRQTLFRNSKQNSDVSTWGGFCSIALPLAGAYLQGAPLISVGLAGAATANVCYTMACQSINNYVNSKLDSTECLNVAALTFRKMRPKDKDFVRGNEHADVRDNVIKLSHNLEFQHRDFEKADAPLKDGILFQSGCDITIGQGVTILSGASGAGKTSLTMLWEQGVLAGAGNLQLGHYEDGHFVGKDYADLKSVSDNIAVAHQQAPESPSLTVGEYIRLENPNADPTKIEEIKNLLHIGDKGETGELSEKAEVSTKTLSGGQQKRLELARALIKDAPIMILDEPTSGVDETMSKNIVAYLKELGKEKNIVYITHDAREIEAIGATQAIDIDKRWSEDKKTNVVMSLDLTKPEIKDQYINLFTKRQSETKVAEDLKTKEMDEKIQKSTAKLRAHFAQAKQQPEKNTEVTQNAAQTGKPTAQPFSELKSDVFSF